MTNTAHEAALLATIKKLTPVLDLAGALPILEGPYTAAQIANGEDPIAKALEGLFLPPPDTA